MNTYEQPIVNWAQPREDIQTIILVGSYARLDHPPDALSDLDLMLFTPQPEAYRDEATWLPQLNLGEIWLHIPYPRSDGAVEHMIVLSGGFKIDFSFEPMAKLVKMIESQQLHEVLMRGYRVLLDRNGDAEKLLPCPYRPTAKPMPTPQEFRALVQSFWYQAMRTAKFLKRGELWQAKSADQAMKESLLTLIEWHERAAHGEHYDTWMEGRFMREWVNPQTWAELRGVHAHFDEADSWRALRYTMTLFQRLTQEIIHHTDSYGSLSDLPEKIRQWIQWIDA
jgi:aminoglycoside 6-adenylyltransferase